MYQVKKLMMAWICLLMTSGLFAQGVAQIDYFTYLTQPLNKLGQQVVDARMDAAQFKEVAPLSLSNKVYSSNTFKNLSKANYLKLDLKQLPQMVADKSEYLSLLLPINDREKVVLDLIRVDLYAEGFHVFTSEFPNEAFEYDPGVFYRGVVRGKEGSSTAAISVFNDQIIGMFSTDEGNTVLYPMKDTKEEILIYNDKDITVNMPFNCSTDELSNVLIDPAPKSEMAAGDCIRVYIECDYALFQNKGDVTATTNWITSVYNNVATLYTAESINTTVSEVYVWTTPDAYSKTSSIDALNKFRTDRGTFNGDLAHLAALGGQNIGGVAWVDALCSSYKYAYSNISASYSTVPTYSWTVEVMTHEMGHNIGSMHTQWCGWTGGALDNCYATEGGCAPGPPPTGGGTIMSYCHLTSYGINFSKGFGTQPGDKIRAEVIAATCLGTSCGGGGGCGVPTGLAISGITQTTATANWNSVSGATSYKFSYKTNAGTTWTTVTTTNPTYNLTGLSAGTLYNTRVKTICGADSSANSATVNFTTSSGGTCGVPTNFAVSNITTNSAKSSWSAVSGATSYNFQYKLASSSTWSQANVTVTTVNLTGLSPNTSYTIRVQAVCPSGTSAFTSIITFKTLNTTYCVSKGNNATYEWVKRVKLGTIDRTSGSDGGYYNGTALSTNIAKSSTQTMNYQAGTTGASGTLYWRVWIDYNRNNVFTDAGEQVISRSSASTGLLTSTFVVPAGASTGSTRMRVSLKYSGYSSPCETFAYGEVEDYSVNIVAAGTLEGPRNQILNMEQVVVSPNPFDQNLLISLSSKQDQQVDVSIIDVFGKKVGHSNYNALTGINAYVLETQHINSGSYFIRIESGDQVIIKKLVKIN